MSPQADRSEIVLTIVFKSDRLKVRSSSIRPSKHELLTKEIKKYGGGLNLDGLRPCEAQMYRIVRGLQTQKHRVTLNPQILCKPPDQGRQAGCRSPCPHSLLSNPAAILLAGWRAIVAEESAACSVPELAAAAFMQGFAEGFEVPRANDFLSPHFRAIPGIFPQAPAHLNKHRAKLGVQP